MTSPSLTSLKPSIPIPHSSPVCTSRTSSWKRRRLETRDARTTPSPRGTPGHASAAHLEHRPHLRVPVDHLLGDRLHYPLEGAFNVLRQAVDDVVVTDVDSFRVRNAHGAGLRANVETDDHAGRGTGQHHV